MKIMKKILKTNGRISKTQTRSNDAKKGNRNNG
jgi:hypothetical protein